MGMLIERNKISFPAYGWGEHQNLMLIDSETISRNQACLLLVYARITHRNYLKEIGFISLLIVGPA